MDDLPAGVFSRLHANLQMPPEIHNEEEFADLSVTEHRDDAEDGQDLSASGDYATRLDEVLGDEDEEEEEFLYQGEDSQDFSGSYVEQLHNVLQGLDEDDQRRTDKEEERHVEEQLEEQLEEDVFVYEEAPKADVHSDDTPSTTSLSLSNFQPETTSTNIDMSPPKRFISKPFLHPNISRLRSFVPSLDQDRIPSVSSVPHPSPSPSHFSAISRTSSLSNLRTISGVKDEHQENMREAFRWAVLRDVGHQIYSRKASTVLGSFHGSPTVLAANGLICIGTELGRVLVFDFKQHLRCVCGTDGTLELASPVSAVSLSHDHTYVAVGHANGHLNLYDLSRPQAPVRSVYPTSLAAVSSGRQEGHIEGTRILALGFVGARHTAIVSADESGLAFYHSLGKVLFVEATDTLRILGKYPNPTSDAFAPKAPTKSSEVSPPHVNVDGGIAADPPRSRPWKPRKSSYILAMASLPLGTAAHPTEAYNLIALLTSAKLVIVGLKPSPRTWFRRHRDNATSVSSGMSKWRGCLAWFPSIDPHGDFNAGEHVNRKYATKTKHSATRPVLAYSWDRTLYLLRVSETQVKQTVQSTKNPGKTTTVEVGKIELEEVARWHSDSDYLAIQWLNVHQILALTATYLEVWDVRFSQRVERMSFDATSLVSCTDSGELPGNERITHNMRVYKGKIFILGRQELKVGTLLSWADRILAFVEDGDFLNAIETARSYYLGTAPGNRMGLPDDIHAMRSLVGKRMRDLMTASARYTFSEDRMTDSTHITPDGQGVDRTSLFEGLVTVCTNACIALGDFEFLFEDLFEEYDNACIAPIFLAQLEPFVLDGTLRHTPPRITQRLIDTHEQRGDLDGAERLIWHIDPECLDINQATTLCRRHGLYDALIYVYTCALHDFVTPVVELLELVRRIQRHRKALRQLPVSPDESSTFPAISHRTMESLVPDAYKIYTYLADVLSGLTYPSQIPMPPDEALRAKRDVYHFLFKGLSYAPAGINGRLILTSDEDGGIEKTYPYVRVLLTFDAEAFLHALDIAFEDSYFNDDPPDVDRLVITRILLEILSTDGLSSFDLTMLNIFIARNVPKYPQSIHMAPSTLHDILVGLAQDPDRSTREDRQLATEYLLSVYTPHDGEKMVALFENAEFFRILRSWHRQEQKWGPLISTYLRDPDINATEIFDKVDEVLTTASLSFRKALSAEILATITDVTPQLLESGITQTARLIDKHAPTLHAQVLERLGDSSQHKQFVYLRCLLEPSAFSDNHYWSDPTLRRLRPSQSLDRLSRELYLKLLCQFDSHGVIRCLESLEDGFFDWDAVISICEHKGVNDAIIWSLDKRGDVSGALKKITNVSTRLVSELSKHFASDLDGADDEHEIRRLVDELSLVCDIGLHICRDHSITGDSIEELTIEDLWFHLLSTQIDTVQTVSSFCSLEPGSEYPRLLQEQQTLKSLRSSVQTTFSSLMALGSSPILSFPRLFKRLVDSTSSSRSSSRSSYSEFRIILAGMLDSYRGEGDLLLITSRLIERDLFTTLEELAKCRSRGLRVRGVCCASCKQPLQRSVALHPPKSEIGKQNGAPSTSAEAEDWLIQRLTGLPFHLQCLPLDPPS